jgi:hypothetical protein
MAKVTLKRWGQLAAAVLIVVLAVGLYRAKSDAAKTEADVRRLNGEIAELESPARIERLNEEQLGLTVGSESAALPESALADRLPAPQAQKGRE